MSKISHTIYIAIMALIVIGVTIFLISYGYSYYTTSVADRFYHPDYQLLNPSGIIGHGLGIIGSLLMIIGVSIYMIRKRVRAFSRVGNLKYWLEFHIFLCTLGPILVLFHTAFRFEGLISIGFWSMVAVFASGVIGRFIYIQIPRSIEGRELSLNEIRGLKVDIGEVLKNDYDLNEESYDTIIKLTKRKTDLSDYNIFYRSLRKYFEDQRNLRSIKKVLRKSKFHRSENKKIIRFVNHEIALNRKIDRLTTMQNIFKYWHVVHLPFAIIMLVIMIIHVTVAIIFGAKWIF